MTHQSFRSFHDEVLSYDGYDLYQDVLRPAISILRELFERLQIFRKLSLSPPGAFEQELLCELFAFDVIKDYLQLPMRLSRWEHIAFFEALGFEPFNAAPPFNPLLHEVVAAGNFYKVEEGITLGCDYWPGLKFGELIFSRAAVDVFCDATLGIVEGIADKSTLYFANRRMHRPCEDASHGWGSNSRWGTDLSRNYLSGNLALLNVDGKIDLAAPGGTRGFDTPVDLARELLLHRCRVQTPAVDDFFPYGWKMAIDVSAGAPWPLAEQNVLPFDVAMSRVQP